MKTFTHVAGLPVLPELTKVDTPQGRLYTLPSGIHVPSVTTVLGHFSKDHIKEWQERVGEIEADAVLKRAGVRGTKFHTMMEKYLRNDKTIFEGVMPDMRQAFRDVKRILNLIDNIHYMEKALYSETLGIAGRSDVIAEFAKTLSIIDFKTSLKKKKEEWITNYFEQATCYSLMLEEMTGIVADQIVIIISVDGEEHPQVFVRDRNVYVDSLLDKIDTYKKEMELVP
jgi:PD-(D/E)XK nuclease superfamily